MESAGKTSYKIASKSSNYLYVLTRGHPRKTQRKPRLPKKLISKSVYMDCYLNDCEQFQVRAAAFKGKREKAVKALLVKAAVAAVAISVIQYFL